jgi:hypothetical protein
VHAVEKRIAGEQALCGAGRIVDRVAGRFDTDDRLACPACSGRLTS